MKKFLIAFLSIVLMFGAVGLTACGSSGSGENDSNNDDIKEAEKGIEDELDNIVLEFSEEEELFGRNGNVITLGEYPQTLKTDKYEITNEQNEKGYYKGTNGCWYAKVTVENIAEEGIFFSTSKEDKVVVGETYYFLVEPLRWRIVEEKDGSALLLCDNIIDCVPYQSLYTTDIVNEENNDKDYFTTSNGAPEGTYANNYEYSDLRKFLNEDFYDKAFSEKEKQLIKDTVVENGINSLSDFCLYKTENNEKVYYDTDIVNSTLANDTTDKVFALSYEECTRESYGFEHRLAYIMNDSKKAKTTTDYAKAKGSYASKNATVGLNYSAGFWMTRSPFYDEYNTGRRFSIVSPTGGPAGEDQIDMMIYHSGVVPAINVELKKGSTGGIAAYKAEDEQSYIIKSIGKATDTEIAIPEKINGLPVTEIAAEAFKDNTAITSVSIPETVTKIGEKAFYGCGTLEKINIPDSIVTIGKEAFKGCTKLNNVSIKKQIENVGENIFAECESLNTITCSIATLSYFDKAILESINIVDSSNIPANCFNGYSSLTSITISDSVTSIGYDAFRDCSSLSSVTIGNSVTSIGSRAFYGCSSLTSVTIPDSVTSIGYDAFYNCSSLTSVIIPDSVTSIGNYAFEYCSALTSVTIGNSVTSIGSSAFEGCSSLTSITIGNSVTSIGSYAFSDCSSLTSITIGNSVTSIGDFAFEDCYKLVEVYNKSSLNITSDSWGNGYVGRYAKNVYTDISGESKLSTDSNGYIIYTDGDDKILVGYTGTETELTLPDGITKINQYAFYWCSSLTSVIIGNSVTSIEDYAFSGCSSLTSVTIPDSVTSIGYDAFSNCSSLTSVIIPDSVTSIGNYAFEYCSALTSVTIGNSVTTIGDMAFYGCSLLTSITIGSSVTSIGNVAFSDCSSLTSVTIPNSVTSIGNYAFDGCYKLVEVYNKSSLNIVAGSTKYGYVGYYAKAVYTEPYTSKLSIDSNGYIIYTDSEDKILVGYTGTETELTLPNGITEINHYAFYNCKSLTSITIGNSVTSIGDYAFYNCDSLTKVIIGNSVTSIGERAFSNCSSLTSVTIPNSVTSIGDYAFRDCNSLTSVYYKGTASEWSNISINVGNDSLKNATRYYYSETQPTETGNYWHYVEGVPTIW